MLAEKGILICEQQNTGVEERQLGWKRWETAVGEKGHEVL